MIKTAAINWPIPADRHHRWRTTPRRVCVDSRAGHFRPSCASVRARRGTNPLVHGVEIVFPARQRTAASRGARGHDLYRAKTRCRPLTRCFSGRVGLEYRILGLICRFTGARVDHAAMWYSLVSPSRIGLRRTWWPARLITCGG